MSDRAWRASVAWRARSARKCPFCGGWKRPSPDVYCPACMENLPAEMAAGLRDDRTYVDGYFTAEKYLTEHPRMPKMTPYRRECFEKFHAIYTEAKTRLEEEAAAGNLHDLAWREAQTKAPLLDSEIPLYKKLVAIHSVNGGQLFAPEWDDQNVSK